VAILWPIERDKYIKKLTDGNERIIAAEIQTKNKPICTEATIHIPADDDGVTIYVLVDHGL
jgi:hypothetical protein